MALPLFDTTKLVDLVLSIPIEESPRAMLLKELSKAGSSQAQFFKAVAEAAKAGSLKLTGNQWFDFNSKIPNRLLRDELDASVGLKQIMSEEQFDKLPPITGSLDAYPAVKKALSES